MIYQWDLSNGLGGKNILFDIGLNGARLRLRSSQRDELELRNKRESEKIWPRHQPRNGSSVSV